MRPHRDRKRPSYAESPDDASIDDSDGEMASAEPQRKRVRYMEESPQQQLSYRIGNAMPMPMPLAMPQPVATTPPPAPLSFLASASPSATLQQTSPPRARRPSNPLHRVGGSYTLETAGLGVPNNLPHNEIRRRQGEIERELAFQAANPPALPASTIADLPPKPATEDWVSFPDDPIPDEQRLAIEAENNRIAATNQRIERERNNQAAKKSRQKRLEALDNTRIILNDRAAECDWWRMRAMALGASVSDWNLLPKQIKDGMVKVIEDRIAVVDQHNENARKQEEARKRLERTRARAARKEGRNAASPASEN
ncbi:hypothetical protein G7Z17_g8335 [Cylindrodendrum hubeiense]|uniref:BZIP domain-containing protein n=1 Tax=Cylindrodendrum hubeiense TaxID=595255 RepID=A0A9P5H1E8_9HYPO|nr:hypothetical protein G7Z17_g8335 [Cylindrodendrum hubeiense]